MGKKRNDMVGKTVVINTEFKDKKKNVVEQGSLHTVKKVKTNVVRLKHEDGTECKVDRGALLSNATVL